MFNRDERWFKSVKQNARFELSTYYRETGDVAPDNKRAPYMPEECVICIVVTFHDSGNYVEAAKTLAARQEGSRFSDDTINSS